MYEPGHLGCIPTYTRGSSVWNSAKIGGHGKVYSFHGMHPGCTHLCMWLEYDWCLKPKDQIDYVMIRNGKPNVCVKSSQTYSYYFPFPGLTGNASAHAFLSPGVWIIARLDLALARFSTVAVHDLPETFSNSHHLSSDSQWFPIVARFLLFIIHIFNWAHYH